jgi:hypothetical protein
MPLESWCGKPRPRNSGDDANLGVQREHGGNRTDV